MNHNQIIWVSGQWSDKDIATTGITDHCTWMASTVFDGARSVKGYLPDLEAHCQRAIRSAQLMGMEPKQTARNIIHLIKQGLTQLSHHTDYYIKILFFCPGGFLQPDPTSTTLAIHIFEAPIPEDNGFSATMSPFQRPDALQAPTEAKASCLYPNSQRALREANARGFNNAIMSDAQGNIAEFTTSNLWIVKKGIALTPVANGTFLNGITRQRLIKLLNSDGIPVEERSLSAEDVLTADEIFSTGNLGKVLYCNKIEDRSLQRGPITVRARQLYEAFTYQSSRLDSVK